MKHKIILKKDYFRNRISGKLKMLIAFFTYVHVKMSNIHIVNYY